MKKDISRIAFNSRLFKGRGNWFFCFLKTERLAEVLAILAGKSVGDAAEALKGSANFAVQIMQDVVYGAAGELQEETLLADVISMISTLRLHANRNYLSRETARVLIDEYEGVIERLAGESKHLGLTVSAGDFTVSSIEEQPLLSPLSSPLPTAAGISDIKDISKGQLNNRTSKGQNTLKGQDRSTVILDVVRKSNGISIKDIVRVVQGCSDKTVQRELNALIKRGLVIREGERRWSTYRAA